jgi:hypothetical protein
MAKKTDKPVAVTPGKGLDVGTAFLVASYYDQGGNVETRKIRDAFLDIDTNPMMTGMLKKSGANYVEIGKKLVVLGDEALQLGNVFAKNPRRPLSQGTIANSDIDALDILYVLIQSVLGAPAEPDEPVVFSVPAAPIDKPGQDVVYHEAAISRLLTKLGYAPTAMNEALAIIYSECAEDNFTGLALSFGAGMVNCVVSFMGVPALTFSLARSGDWVDEQSAKAVGKTAGQMQVVKEAPTFDLTKPVTREEQAIAAYYSSLIDYALESITAEFKKVESTITMPGAIPLVVAGGTSLPKGFIETFRERFKAANNFPIPIKEIRHASDPLLAVSKGLLVAASV